MIKLKQINKIVGWNIRGNINSNYIDTIIRMACILFLSLILTFCFWDYIFYSQTQSNTYVYCSELASASFAEADSIIVHYPKQFHKPVNIYFGKRISANELDSGYYYEMYPFGNKLPSDTVYLSSDLFDLVKVFPFETLSNMEHRKYDELDLCTELFDQNIYVAVVDESTYKMRSSNVDLCVIAFDFELSEKELINLKNYLNSTTTVKDIQPITETNDLNSVNYNFIRLVVIIFSIIGEFLVWIGYITKRKSESYCLFVTGVDFIAIGILNFLTMILLSAIVGFLLIIIITIFVGSVNVYTIIFGVLQLIICPFLASIYNLISMKGWVENV